jgi:hypothetical protein
MANSLSVLNAEKWFKNRIGRTQRKTLVARDIANTRFRMENGFDTINLPYTTPLTSNAYVKGVDVTIQDIAPTNEQLVIATAREASFYVDEIDGIQNIVDIAAEKADEAAYVLNKDIDTAVFGEYANVASGHVVDAGDVGGTATNPIDLVTATANANQENMLKLFAALKRRMRIDDVPMMGDTFIVVDAVGAELLELMFVNKGFNVADSTLKNGYAGSVLGVDVYVSNNLTTAAGVTHYLGGRKGAIDLVVQREPSLKVTQPEKKIGKNYITWTLYGKKTFYEGGRELYDIRVDVTP